VAKLRDAKALLFSPEGGFGYLARKPSAAPRGEKGDSLLERRRFARATLLEAKPSL
jgi:hypothetical protein